jgi:tripartite-type tricarboxylate transporter receptor subunit TctC
MKAGQNALIALAISTAFAGSAAGAADFYANKQLTLMANFAPGGPTDVEARFLAKHLPKYLKGSPKIIVQNRGGGGGTVGLNWLGEVAKPDGLTLGYLSGIVSRRD